MPDFLTNPSATPAPTPIGPLVLIVDDDDDTRFLYAESLQSMGYRTAGECDAQRGIDAAFRLQPDAIVMDIAMPGMSGIEATRILKADPRTSRCIVTVVTGSVVVHGISSTPLMNWYRQLRGSDPQTRGPLSLHLP